tara:strand:+ start:3073 stop:3987 length:915 start_codon:yes stop_codon:yes gene_type:complete
MSENFIDQLSFQDFLNESSKESKITKAKPFNRLIAHSKNFFIVSGYGSFTPGYQIIVTKEFIPSFGLVNEENLDELQFLIKISKEYINKEYKKKSVIFEHGMCACIGGLDRAHLHVMSVNDKTSEKSLSESIDRTLYKRKAGIEYITFKNFKLHNFHDINHFIENSKNDETKKFKIKGKILKVKDIKNLSHKKWPKITLDHIKKGGHYVFFKSDYDNSCFLTTNNFQTQFGREVVYENEIKLDKLFKDKIKKIKSKNEYLQIWRWQNCMFESEIIQTVNSGKLKYKELQKFYKEEYKKFNFKVI